MSTGKGLPPPPPSDHDTAKDPRGNAIRIAGAKVDPSPLKESITFPFSGRTAKNRFLKAPMTERLCHWNKEGEEIVSTNWLAYPRLLEASIH